MKIDFKSLNFKYCIAAAIQLVMLIFWFVPSVSVGAAGYSQSAAVQDWLEANSLGVFNILFILCSIAGIALFVLPMFMPNKRFPQFIDLPAEAATIIGIVFMLLFYMDGAKTYEFIPSVSVSFTFGGVLFMLLAIGQAVWCTMIRMKIKKAKKAEKNAQANAQNNAPQV